MDLAGILADEMGLGKTAPGAGLSPNCRRPARSSSARRRSSSTGQREAARFTPERRVARHRGRGSSAALWRPIAEADLVITSYPLLRRDADRYRDASSPPRSSTRPSTSRIPRAKMPRPRSPSAPGIASPSPAPRSKTRVRDLWSLMNFLMPGYLGSGRTSGSATRRRSQSDPAARRSKRSPAPLAPVCPPPDQSATSSRSSRIKSSKSLIANSPTRRRTFYAELSQSARRQTSRARRCQDQGKARMLMLTALLRLRQACCDLRLLGRGMPRSRRRPPPRSSCCDELLAEAIDGGHRVLIFSQFVSMLTLLREALEGRRTSPCCYLDGQTKDRAAEVDRFQTGEVPGLPDQPQSRRHRPEPHRRRHRHSFRPVVESRRRSPGHRPRPPHRPGEGRHQLQAHRPRHRRGENPRPAASANAPCSTPHSRANSRSWKG